MTEREGDRGKLKKGDTLREITAKRDRERERQESQRRVWGETERKQARKIDRRKETKERN